MEAPLSLSEAQRFVGADVSKEFAEGTFEGKVVEVNEELYTPGEEGRILPGTLWFRVRYEDGDGEDLPWDQMKRILLHPARYRKRKSSEGLNNTPENGKLKKPRRTGRPPDSPENSSEENSGTATNSRSLTALPPRTPATRQRPPLGQQAGRARRSTSPEIEPVPNVDAENDDGAALRHHGLAGQIKHVKLQNFMCHDNFEVKFGPHVNFVSGSNGSGKSAVLQAMQCCLGVRARATGRGTSVKGFIKQGCSEAWVRVAIWNTGDDAHAPEQLGQSVEIERRIGQKSSTIVVRDSRGRTVLPPRAAAGNKKTTTWTMGELEDLLGDLNVDASNPVSVMTQDVSRTFLGGTADAAKKYKLYMRATQLDRSNEHIMEAMERLNQIERIVNKTQAQYDQAKLEKTEAKKAFRAVEGLGNLKSLVTDAGLAGSWAMVRDKERDAEILATNMTHAQAQMDELRARRDETAAQVAAKQAERDGKKTSLTENEEFYNQRTAQQKTFQARIKAARAAKRKFERAAEAAATQAVDHENQKTDIETELAKDRGELLAQTQAAADEYSEALRALQADHEDKAKAAQALMDQKRALIAEKAEADEAAKSSNQSVRECTALAERAKHDLSASRAARTNAAAAFGGAEMATLCERLAQAGGRFERAPVGPIGAYLSLRDSKDAVLVDAALGAQLGQFRVHSNRDRIELESLAQAVGGVRFKKRLKCVVGSMDTPRHRPTDFPQNGFRSLLDCVVIQDGPAQDVVYNFLVDFGQASSIAAADSKQAAESVIYNLGAGSHCMRAFDPTGAKYWRRGGNRTVQTNRNNRPPRLGVSVEEQVTYHEQQVMEHEQRKAHYAGRAADANSKAREIAQALQRLERQMRTAFAARAAAHSAVTDMQANAPTVANEGDDEGDELAQSLIETQAAIDRARGDEDSARRVAAEKDAEIAEAQQEMEAGKAEFDAAREQMTTLLEQYEGLVAEVTTIEAEVKACDDALNRVNALIPTKAAELDAMRHEAQQMRAAVTEQYGGEAEGEAALQRVGAHCIKKRVDAERKAAEREGRAPVPIEIPYLGEKDLANIMKRLEDAVRKQEREAGGTLEELHERYVKKKKAWERVHKTHTKLDALYTSLQNGLVNRGNKLENMQAEVEKAVSHKFRQYLLRRDATGRIEVEHEGPNNPGGLTISVKMDGKTNPHAKAVHDLKQLSGGERSYTTIAFIVSLGYYNECPFRCMDEYDVFMDSVNRRMSTLNLLEFARQRPELQFIFLTPQDLQTVDDARKQLEAKLKEELPENFCKIVKMQAARRA